MQDIDLFVPKKSPTKCSRFVAWGEGNVCWGDQSGDRRESVLPWQIMIGYISAPFVSGFPYASDNLSARSLSGSARLNDIAQA